MATIPGDLRDPEYCRTLVAEAVAALGGLDILVNNGGKQVFQESLTDVTDEQFDDTFKTNVYAMFWITKAALPHLPAGSTIINTTSIQAYSPSDILVDYASTKSTINAFTKGLAQQLAPKGIRVNAVAPGPIWTPLQPSDGQPQEKIAQFGQDTPLGRMGQPAELAPAYVFLASPESSYVLGETLNVNGGMPTPDSHPLSTHPFRSSRPLPAVREGWVGRKGVGRRRGRKGSPNRFDTCGGGTVSVCSSLIAWHSSNRSQPRFRVVAQRRHLPDLPRSFADASGDGIGDLPGITSRLDSLQELGVDAIWLSPFMTSPQRDAGYDVADYRDVDPLFGTLADFDLMLAEAHARDIRVIVDLVPNHSSDQHPWFQEALKAAPGSPERARYIFRDGRGENGELPRTTGSRCSAAACGSASPRPTARRVSGTCTSSTPRSPTSTGTTRRCRRSSARSCASGSTAVSTASGSMWPTA